MPSERPPRDGAPGRPDHGVDRRTFVKRGCMAVGGLGLGVGAVGDLFLARGVGEARRAFLRDAPATLPPSARPAEWWEAAGGFVHCRLCPHQCVLADEDRGFCRARVAKAGTLYTLVYGNPCSVHVDPVEKKPLYHFLPGSAILSLATAGCSLRCLNCQNWEISQARPSEVASADLAPATVAEYAARQGIPSLAYTYTEPLVFYEYAHDTSVQARQRGLRNVLVSAGYIEEAPLRRLCAVTDGANVDLKSFDEEVYQRLVGGSLAPVLRCLVVMKQEGVWLEVTRLLVPGHSDDLDDIRRQCDWMARTLGPETPLHLSRFHPAYRLQGLPPTPLETLDRAHELALAAGLHHVYVGNVPGNEAQDTLCPACGRPVIRRQGYHVLGNDLRHGRCPCGAPMPGVWL